MPHTSHASTLRHTCIETSVTVDGRVVQPCVACAWTWAVEGLPVHLVGGMRPELLSLDVAPVRGM